jgi:hypothetical protein
MDVSNVTFARRAISTFVVASTPCMGAELPPYHPLKERVVSDDFKPGLEGVIAFESEIAEPDKEGSALRYRGVDI